ncbi:MAG TPA: MBOAT family O-acyltransferase [Bryobacteraceae bacterium]|nr:MBOAT family O-acyltransferase [Bryobacteraceae bacterium]
MVVLILFYASPLRLRRFVLLLSSYFFYMAWNPKFIALLLILTAIDYWAGQWIEKTVGPRRVWALWISLGANLGFLGFFKYTNFLIDNLAWLAGVPPAGHHLAIVLPLGISFHTFQSISYVVDVYRRQQKAITDPIDYALFIAFFPQLVAGPIVRAHEFFGDLYHWRAPWAEEVQRGVVMILIGLVKKIVLADQFAGVADRYFNAVTGTPGTAAAWSGTIAFAMQIFFDFSGYTDIAIGCALLFGFHFPVNFRRPYLAHSLTDFWRRWHMSLSRWLRNYLYIPLGGNRHGTWHTYRNLILTMLIGGLWHGASWNFVIWGGYHGVILAIERMFGIHREAEVPRSHVRPIRTLLTFVLVTIGWVFFRARTLGDSLLTLHRMFTFENGSFLLDHRHIAFIAITLVVAIIEEKRQVLEHLGAAPAWVHAMGVALVLAAIEIFGVTDQSIPFVYFQF